MLKKSEMVSDKDLFVWDMISQKVKRLYPEYFFNLVIYLLVGIFILKKTIVLSDFFYNAMMLGHIGIVNNIVEGGWYVSALFWTTVVFIAIFASCRKTTFFVLSMLIFIMSTIIFFGKKIPLDGASGLIFPFLSTGFLRAFAGMSFGIMLSFLFSKLKTINFHISHVKETIFIILLEIFSVCYLCDIFMMNKNANFALMHNIYFPLAIIMFIFYFKKEKILKIANLRIFEWLGKYVYMIYLSNLILEVIIFRRFKMPRGGGIC
jgi:peptidoglycan/LPS O-acetylase OafA/YrhL